MKLTLLFKNCFLCALCSILVGVPNSSSSASSFAAALEVHDTPTSLFDSFRDEAASIEKEKILWTCVQTALEHREKSINLAKHLIKGQHLIPISEIEKKPALQLALPVVLDKANFDFAKSIYLMLDVSKERMGQIQVLKNLLIQSKLSPTLPIEELLKTIPEPILQPILLNVIFYALSVRQIHGFKYSRNN